MDFPGNRTLFVHGELLPEPGVEEIRTIMIEHLNNLYEFYGEYTGVRVARKHIAWYSKGQPDGAGFRQRINCWKLSMNN